MDQGQPFISSHCLWIQWQPSWLSFRSFTTLQKAHLLKMITSALQDQCFKLGNLVLCTTSTGLCATEGSNRTRWYRMPCYFRLKAGDTFFNSFFTPPSCEKALLPVKAHDGESFQPCLLPAVLVLFL